MRSVLASPCVVAGGPASVTRRVAVQPRPEDSAEYGSPDVRRMHVGRYHVMYEIAEASITIVVVHLGRIG